MKKIFNFLFLSSVIVNGLIIGASHSTNLMLTTLLDRIAYKKCLTFLYGVDKDIINEVDFNSVNNVGQMVWNVQDNMSWKWKSFAHCFVGIAPLEKTSDLQILLLLLPKKQLILYAEELNGTQTAQHHIDSVDRSRIISPLILHSNKMYSGCNDRLLPTDTIKSGSDSWFIEQDVSFMNIERLCNEGNNVLYGKNLIASVFGFMPWVSILQRSHSGPQTIGVGPDALGILAKYYGFQVGYKPARSFGTALPNGTLVGSRGDVQNGFADLAIDIPLKFRGPDASRFAGMVTMTHPWYVRRGYFYTSYPVPLPKWFNFLLPYDGLTWLSLGLSVLLMTAALVLTLRPSHMSLKVPQDVFLLVFGIMYHEYSPTWKSLRHRHYGRRWVLAQGPLLRFVWVVAAMFLVQAYQSNLKASLVIKPMEKQIGSMQEMVDRDIPIYMPLSMLQLLELTGKDQISRDIAKRVRKKNSILPMKPDLPVLVEKLVHEQGTGAGYIFREVADYEQGVKRRRGESYYLDRIDDILVYSYQTLAFPYGSPLVEFLNPAIRRIFESGSVQKLYNHYGSDPSLMKEVNRELEHLEVEHIIVPLCLLPIAFIISALAFAKEKGWIAFKRTLKS